MGKHNMLKHISWQRRAEIVEQIAAMKPGAEKIILELAFINEMSTLEIAEYCQINQIISRNHRPYSRRMISNIIIRNVPEYGMKNRPPNPQSRKRAGHERARDAKEKTFCAFCGCRDNLEMHHMIPAFLGGTEDNANLIWLCKKCHKDVTAYQRAHFKSFFYHEKA